MRLQRGDGTVLLSGGSAEYKGVRPLVSVITLTYNQAHFLPQCIESIQAQVGDFDLEHVVVDDASADDTPKILSQYANLKVIRHDMNTGANQGMVEAYAGCKGEFVAICEGDDWWLASDKLHEQVRLMQRRPDLAMCFHDAVTVHESKLQWPSVRPGCGNPVRTLDELLVDNFAHTCTVMYRRIPGLEYPEWYTKFMVGDWPNHAFHAARGGIGYINRPMAAYRIHDKGSWSAKDSHQRIDEICRMLKELDAHFLFRYNERISSTIERISSEAVEAAA
jgi:glycosyltransferase involved in cell wall biosynthesis